MTEAEKRELMQRVADVLGRKLALHCYGIPVEVWSVPRSKYSQSHQVMVQWEGGDEDLIGRISGLVVNSLKPLCGGKFKFKDNYILKKGETKQLYLFNFEFSLEEATSLLNEQEMFFIKILEDIILPGFKPDDQSRASFGLGYKIVYKSSEPDRITISWPNFAASGLSTMMEEIKKLIDSKVTEAGDRRCCIWKPSQDNISMILILTDGLREYLSSERWFSDISAMHRIVLDALGDLDEIRAHVVEAGAEGGVIEIKSIEGRKEFVFHKGMTLQALEAPPATSDDPLKDAAAAVEAVPIADGDGGAGGGAEVADEGGEAAATAAVVEAPKRGGGGGFFHAAAAAAEAFADAFDEGERARAERAAAEKEAKRTKKKEGGGGCAPQ